MVGVGDGDYGCMMLMDGEALMVLEDGRGLIGVGGGRASSIVSSHDGLGCHDSSTLGVGFCDGYES